MQHVRSIKAANDPEDYFDYVMFAWGNCQASDRLVMKRKLGRFPDENGLKLHMNMQENVDERYASL